MQMLLATLQTQLATTQTSITKTNGVEHWLPVSWHLDVALCGTGSVAWLNDNAAPPYDIRNRGKNLFNSVSTRMLIRNSGREGRISQRAILPSGQSVEWHFGQPFGRMIVWHYDRVALRLLRHDFCELSLRVVLPNSEIVFWRNLLHEIKGTWGEILIGTNGITIKNWSDTT